MARGENPSFLLQIPTTLAYNARQDFGNNNAGKHLALSLIETGNNAGKAQLAAANAKILGVLIEVHKGNIATYQPVGYPIIMIKGSADTDIGRGVIGAGSGKIVTTPDTATAAAATNARGTVLKNFGTADGSEVLVLLN